MVTEHIKVDDEVIDKGNPFKVIEPVWWTADIYDGEAQYEYELLDSQGNRDFFLQ